MFWNRKKSDPPAAARSHAEQVHEMALAALTASAIDFDSAPKAEQAVVSVFFFGMASAHGMLNKLPQEETIALARGAYQSAFKLKLAQAAKAVQDGIKATKPGPHQKMTSVLHSGIDGQAQHAAGNFGALAANIGQCLAAVRTPKA